MGILALKTDKKIIIVVTSMCGLTSFCLKCTSNLFNVSKTKSMNLFPIIARVLTSVKDAQSTVAGCRRASFGIFIFPHLITSSYLFHLQTVLIFLDISKVLFTISHYLFHLRTLFILPKPLWDLHPGVYVSATHSSPTLESSCAFRLYVFTLSPFQTSNDH